MSEFHFLRPYWWLAVIPAAWFCWQLWRMNYSSRGWRAVCDQRLLPFLLTATGVQRRRWPVVLLALLLLFGITALAGPVWKKIPQPVFRKESALVIAVDLSRSMDAQDIKPSRLARARLKIIDILRRRQEGQTALIAYAGDAFTVSPLTEDSNTIVALDRTLTTDLMPAQGSKPAKALQLATQLLQQAGVTHGNILLVTDGIDSASPAKLASLVTQQGHRLFVLGVGTQDGAPIPVAGGGFVTDSKGGIVIPKLKPAVLQQLATQGQGRFHVLTTDDTDLNDLLAGINSQQLHIKTKATHIIADRWQEEGPWLLLIILPFAALAFRRGIMVVLLVCFLPAIPRPAQAMDWNQLWQRPDQRAAKELRDHKMDQADKTLPDAKVFHNPEWKAAAYYRHGQYQKAVQALKDVHTADGFYNKGNALAKMGQLQPAIQAYDQALKLDPKHADAKYNREQVEKQLKKQKQQQKKNQQQNKQQNNKQQKKSDSQKKSGGKSSQDKKNNNGQKGKQDQQQKDAQGKNSNQDQQSKSSEQQKQSAKDKQQQARQAEQQKQQAKQNEANKDQAKAGQPKPQPQDKAGQQRAAPMTEEERKQKERQQADEQWLRRIPDDPGGLLRRKFKYQYQQRHEGQSSDNSDGQQSW